jgi:hypothetical protein
VSVLEQEIREAVAVNEVDRMEFAAFIRMVVSDPELRDLLAVDAQAAVAKSGVTLSPFAVQMLTENASRAVALTADMDTVITSFFFFLIA